MKRIEGIYDHARQTMEVQQEVSATYYDRKIIDDQLDCGELVYMFLPRNRRIKLAQKWAGPAKIVKTNHPLYEIMRRTKKGNVVTSWTIRNKLKRAPRNALWSGEHFEEKNARVLNEKESSSSSESEHEADNAAPPEEAHNPEQNEHYNLRDRNRWGRYYGMDAYVSMLV